MLQGQSPSHFKLAISNLLSQNNQPNKVSMPARSSPAHCDGAHPPHSTVHHRQASGRGSSQGEAKLYSKSYKSVGSINRLGKKKEPKRNSVSGTYLLVQVPAAS